METKMSAISFLYWLQGSIELGGLNKLNKNQIELIKKHMLISDDSYFKTWLDGFLSDKQNSVNKKQFILLKTELEKAFTKVSDKNLVELSKLFEESRKKYPWEESKFLIGKSPIIC